jgi:hypothetical protein
VVKGALLHLKDWDVVIGVQDVPAPAVSAEIASDDSLPMGDVHPVHVGSQEDVAAGVASGNGVAIAFKAHNAAVAGQRRPRRRRGRKQLKGIKGRQRVYEVVWE